MDEKIKSLKALMNSFSMLKNYCSSHRCLTCKFEGDDECLFEHIPENYQIDKLYEAMKDAIIEESKKD